MPIYEYKCDACQVRMERSHPMSDPPLTDCPECGQPKLRKIFSTGGILGASSKAADSMPAMPSCPAAGGGCSSGMCGMG